MIKSFDYLASLPEIEADLKAAFARVLGSGHLILGPETEAFEAEFAAAVGLRHCVAVTSGTAALYLALKALEIGPHDEVVTVANTCVPTVAAIRMTGARPRFVDVDPDTLMMDVHALGDALGPRVRAIVAVHLWGNAVNLDALSRLAERHAAALIEDCAQAMGTRYRGRQVGAVGAAACFSFYPTKNLGAYGDGGAVVTDDADLADRLRKLRMYGYDERGLSVFEGVNARINEVQAALLRVKLRVFDRWQARRAANARALNRSLRGVGIPGVTPAAEHAYHQYVVRSPRREALAKHLTEHGIGFGIHYPVPVHKMPVYRDYQTPLPVTEAAAGEILSLPVHEALQPAEVGRIIAAVNSAE